MKDSPTTSMQASWRNPRGTYADGHRRGWASRMPGLRPRRTACVSRADCLCELTLRSNSHCLCQLTLPSLRGCWIRLWRELDNVSRRLKVVAWAPSGCHGHQTSFSKVFFVRAGMAFAGSRRCSVFAGSIEWHLICSRAPMLLAGHEPAWPNSANSARDLPHRGFYLHRATAKPR